MKNKKIMTKLGFFVSVPLLITVLWLSGHFRSFSGKSDHAQPWNGYGVNPVKMLPASTDPGFFIPEGPGSKPDTGKHNTLTSKNIVVCIL